jgi:hypothetical protein
MQTLDPPTRTRFEPGEPACTQQITGDSGPEEQDGKITSGDGKPPQPLQGEGDTSETPGRENETGNEGGGS